jgi:uncharacterized phage protein (TIGR01671 family)
MREILFRGRRIDTGEWVYGHPVGWQNESGDISIVDSRFGACIDADGNLMMIEAPFVVKVDPSTIGQFTGRTAQCTDKIFEGDRCILTLFDYNGSDTQYDCVVEWAGGCFAFVNEEKNVFVPLCNVDDTDSDVEVIGTIHDKEAAP